jgi:hypothetical protein
MCSRNCNSSVRLVPVPRVLFDFECDMYVYLASLIAF